MCISIPEHGHEQELVYKMVDGTPLYLTFLPPKKWVEEVAPVLAVISGGGWQVQSREAILGMYASSVEQLRQAGVCVVSFDYRVTSIFPNATAGEEVGDALDAIAYLNCHAQVLGIDPERIALTGHSAGGHIALLMAYAPRDMFPTAYPDPGIAYMGCIPFSAPCVLYSSESLPKALLMEYDYIFPGKKYDDKSAHAWSPYDHIAADCPPTLFIYGDSDDLVPAANSSLSYEKGIALGASFTRIHPANGGHSLEAMKEGVPVIPSYEEIQNSIVAWVCKLFDL